MNRYLGISLPDSMEILMQKLGPDKKGQSSIATAFMAVIICAWSLLMLPMTLLAQSSSVSSPGPPTKRHFILLIDDSGSMSQSRRRTVGTYLPDLLFGGIPSGGQTLRGFDPQSDRVSMVFFTILKNSGGCEGGRRALSANPEDMFELVNLPEIIGGREAFTHQLNQNLNRGCRGGGDFSPIAISQLLVLEFLQKSLPPDELHSQTILIVASDGEYNSSPNNEFTTFLAGGVNRESVERARRSMGRLDRLFDLNAPPDWLKQSGGLFFLAAELIPSYLAESSIQYLSNAPLEPQAVSSSKLRYSLRSQSVGDIQILPKRADSTYEFVPLWLRAGFQNKSGQPWRIGNQQLPGEVPPLSLENCNLPQCVKRDGVLGVSLFDLGGSRVFFSPNDPNPESGRIKFRVGFKYQTGLYDHLYVETPEQVIATESASPTTLPNFFFFLQAKELSKQDLVAQYRKDDDGVTTPEEARNRLQSFYNLIRDLLTIVLVVAALLTAAYFFLTAYQRRFHPELKWLSVPEVVVDFNRPAASRLLVGTLKVINNEKVPWLGNLFGNKEQPTRWATVSLDYDFSDQRELEVTEGNPIGFVIGDKQTSRHEGLERGIQESVSDGKQIHVFLASDTIRDLHSGNDPLEERDFEIPFNAKMNWVPAGDQSVGQNGQGSRSGMALRLRSALGWLRGDKPGSRSLLAKCLLTVRPEEPLKPRVVYEPAPVKQKLHFKKGKEIEIGKFIFKSQALHSFARPFESGNYLIRSYRDNRPLAGEPIKLDPSNISISPGYEYHIPVKLVCDAQEVPNPDPVSCEYAFKLVGEFDADSAPGPHLVTIYRDTACAEIELMLTHPQPQREIFWDRQGQPRQRLLLSSGAGAEERSLENQRLTLESRDFEFDPNTTRPLNLLTLQFGNSALSGRGFVAVDLKASILCDKEALNSIETADQRPLDDLVSIYKRDVKDRRIHLNEGDAPQTRDIRFDPSLITSIKGARIESQNFSVEVELRIHVRTDQGEESHRKLIIAIPLGLEQMPGENWLAIDFGTSAISAALGTGGRILPIPLQNLKLDDGGTSLGEYDLFNSEHGNPYLLPSWVICDADTRTEAIAKCKPGFPGYFTENLNITPGEPEFIGLPALKRYLGERSNRVIYSLKSWLGKSSGSIRLGTKIKFKDEQGRETTSDKIHVDKAVESGFAALAKAYLLVNKSDDRTNKGDYPADQIVICYPNTFTQRHKELLHEIAFRALAKPDRFGISLKERIQLISESDAVAYHYCAQRMSRNPRAGTERILVYDFGAGTLDLSLIRVEWKTEPIAYPTHWEVEGRLGVPVAGNYLDELLARVVDQLLRDQSLRGAGSVEYQYPVVTDSRKKDEEGKYHSAVIRLWDDIREAKHQWDGQSPMNIRVGRDVGALHLVKAESGFAELRDEPPEGEAGLWRKGSEIYLTIPPRMIHDDPRVSEFIRFTTATVIDELLYAANISAPEVHTVVVSGRGALWPGLRDQVKSRFLHASQPSWEQDSDDGEVFAMKSAVVRGAIARQDLLMELNNVVHEAKWQPKLGVLINHDEDLIREEDWDKPIDLRRSPTFRIVQVNLKNPNPREDMRSLRRHFYIDLAGQRFRREGAWARTRELRIRKDNSDGKLAIYLEDRDQQVSIPIFAETQAGETVTSPPWPVGNFLLDPIR